MTTKEHNPLGAQPEDPPWWRLVFLLVQGSGVQWWRGFALVALIGLLLVGVVVALLVSTGWAGGALGVGSLPALVVALRRRHRLGRR